MDTEQKPITGTQFGKTTRFIAALLGIPPELSLAYLASVLTSLSGPFARIRNGLGQELRPGFSLVLVERHPGQGRALSELAVQPAKGINDRRRRESRCLDARILADHRDFPLSKYRQDQQRLLSALDSFESSDRVDSYYQALFEERQNWQPSLLVTGPRPESFDSALCSVADSSPLVLDTAGIALREASRGGSPRDLWAKMTSKIFAGAREGFDAQVPAQGPSLVDTTVRVQTPFVFHLPEESLESVLSSYFTRRVSEVALLLPMTPCDAWPVNSDQRAADCRMAVSRYGRATEAILQRRIDNQGVVFEPDCPLLGLWEGAARIERRLDQLPPRIGRFCGGLRGLPMHLLWAALALDDPKCQNVLSLVPSVLRTAEWCVDQQVALVRRVVEEIELRALRKDAILMFRKLLAISLPCRLADLQRKYHAQRKDQLWPVLHFLNEENVVLWDRERNEIRLVTDAPRPEWLKEGGRRASPVPDSSSAGGGD